MIDRRSSACILLFLYSGPLLALLRPFCGPLLALISVSIWYYYKKGQYPCAPPVPLPVGFLCACFFALKKISYWFYLIIFLWINTWINLWISLWITFYFMFFINALIKIISKCFSMLSQEGWYKFYAFDTRKTKKDDFWDILYWHTFSF